LRKILLFWKFEWLDVGQLRDAIGGSDDQSDLRFWDANTAGSFR